MSDTPRTDEFWHERGDDVYPNKTIRSVIEFCRQLERELQAANERAAESDCDKILAMSDAQIKALCAFTGHNPSDEAAIAKQACELALLRVDLQAANERAERSEEDAARYRWLRSEEVSTDPRFYEFWQEFNTKLCREKKLDILIDDARRALAVDRPAEDLPADEEKQRPEQKIPAPDGGRP